MTSMGIQLIQPIKPPGLRGKLARPMSKSELMAHRQCAKRQWEYRFHKKERATPFDAETLRRFDTGNRVNDILRMRYPQGVVVTEPGWEWALAVSTTEALMNDPQVGAIFEGALFLQDVTNVRDMGLGVRVDALVRHGDGWIVGEAKSTKGMYYRSRDLNAQGEVTQRLRMKDRYLFDLAIQLYVAERNGLSVSQAGVIHLSAEYLHDGSGVYDPLTALTFSEVTAQARALFPEVEALIADSRRSAGLRREPNIQTGSQCRKPYECEFIAYCESQEPPIPATDVRTLYGYSWWSSRGLRARFARENITEITQIPPDFNEAAPRLSAIQLRQIEAVGRGALSVETVGLRAAMEELRTNARLNRGRLSFLDFETISPQLPMLAGTKPGEMVVLQFSNHYYDDRGGLQNDAYLYDPSASEDPFVRTAEALVATLDHAGPVVVWNARFERARLREIASKVRVRGHVELARQLDALTGDAALHALANRLDAQWQGALTRKLRAVIGSDSLVRDFVTYLQKQGESEVAAEIEAAKAWPNNRIVDLLEIVRDHVFHPDQHSFSIKSVLKHLVPGKSYDDLEGVTHGGEATIALEEMVHPDTAPARVAELREQLRIYCARDTMAEVWIYEHLCELIGLDPRPY
jgi:hypothetical protein